MQVVIFKHTLGCFSTIEEDIVQPLNYFLKNLDNEGYCYDVKYVSTGDGFVSIVEYWRNKKS